MKKTPEQIEKWRQVLMPVQAQAPEFAAALAAIKKAAVNCAGVAP